MSFLKLKKIKISQGMGFYAEIEPNSEIFNMHIQFYFYNIFRFFGAFYLRYIKQEVI